MNVLKITSLASSLAALLTCICMGFELFGHHTDYELVAIEAVAIGACLAINLVCAILRLIQETYKS